MYMLFTTHQLIQTARMDDKWGLPRIVSEGERSSMVFSYLCAYFVRKRTKVCIHSEPKEN